MNTAAVRVGCVGSNSAGAQVPAHTLNSGIGFRAGHGLLWQRCRAGCQPAIQPTTSRRYVVLRQSVAKAPEFLVFLRRYLVGNAAHRNSPTSLSSASLPENPPLFNNKSPVKCVEVPI